jgi:hypothetical protein
MDNPEKLTTLGTQDTGRKQTKQKHNTENYKMSNSQMLDITIGGVMVSVLASTRMPYRVSDTDQTKDLYLLLICRKCVRTCGEICLPMECIAENINLGSKRFEHTHTNE